MSEGNGHLTDKSELFGGVAQRRYKELDPLPVSRFKLRIQSITENEYSRFQAMTFSKRGSGLRHDKLVDANRRFIALCLVDGDGNRMMSDGDAKLLTGWDAGDTSVLYNECANHCGINKEDIEELVGNSDEIHGD